MTAIARPRTFLNLVLDESISMDDVRDETILAVNKFLRSQIRSRIDELFVTLTKFSSAGRVQTLYRNVPGDQVPLLSPATYTPGGFTALYDGIYAGMSGAEEGTGPGDRILMVIVTDGEENDSKVIPHVDYLKSLIVERERRGNWTFVFLAANIDAFGTASKMGVSVGNTDSYTTDAGGVQAAITKVDAAVKSYRTSDDLKVDNFYHQPKKWQRPQWAKPADVVVTDDPNEG